MAPDYPEALINIIEQYGLNFYDGEGFTRYVNASNKTVWSYFKLDEFEFNDSFKCAGYHKKQV